MRSLSVIVAFLLLCIPLSAAADTQPNYCFQEAEDYYHVSARILWAISKVESNHNPMARHVNDNGTVDIGHMQINSSWKAVIGEASWSKLDDPCYNTMIGAWIFANCVQKYGYSWQAVGCYNSQTPAKRDSYAMKVFKELERLRKSEEAVGQSAACKSSERNCQVTTAEDSSS